MGRKRITKINPTVDSIFRYRTKKKNRKNFHAGFFNDKINIKRKFQKEFPRSLVVLFVLIFVLTSITFTYVISGGRPIFGPSVSGVNENDMFYQFFVDDEAKANVMGPKGGPDSDPATLKLFTYTIGKDDSLSKIAQKTGVTLDALISVNKLNDAHMIRVGANLTIPNQKGIYYKVKRNDTLPKIGKRYKVCSDDIVKVNGITHEKIVRGMVLFLPGAKLTPYQMEKALGLIFRRPARGGWLSSGYGYRRNPFTMRHQFHPGIDIALPYWTPINAVRSGRVIFSGWRGGYGKLVVLKHNKGLLTKYGHMIKYTVRAGQWIRAGQRIGYVGSTGYSTGPHLHFEIRKYGRLLNPFRVRGFRRAYRRGY